MSYIWSTEIISCVRKNIYILKVFYVRVLIKRNGRILLYCLPICIILIRNLLSSPCLYSSVHISEQYDYFMIWGHFLHTFLFWVFVEIFKSVDILFSSNWKNCSHHYFNVFWSFPFSQTPIRQLEVPYIFSVSFWKVTLTIFSSSLLFSFALSTLPFTSCVINSYLCVYIWLKRIEILNYKF